ncbi:hypothetical protein AAFF_G00141140 [Aldrovandia affinis]|uniref:Uncharacterized protein n=1 Tax=Aldrovandia affinis TaxID=143900 RepID=A0AAD7TCI2_9TELE|nr:hypothetical protein AAFF_G00141140 [Aldrovandia affinis]
MVQKFVWSRATVQSTAEGGADTETPGRAGTAGDECTKVEPGRPAGERSIASKLQVRLGRQRWRGIRRLGVTRGEVDGASAEAWSTRVLPKVPNILRNPGASQNLAGAKSWGPAYRCPNPTTAAVGYSVPPGAEDLGPSPTGHNKRDAQ